MRAKVHVLLGTASILSGCASLQFHTDARKDEFVYYEPSPFVRVTISKDCAYAADAIVLPGPRRSVALKSGWGSSTLKLVITNGMITEIGQTTDNKGGDPVAALTSVLKSVGVLGFDGATTCQPGVVLFPITTDANGGMSISTEPTFKFGFDMDLTRASSTRTQPASTVFNVQLTATPAPTPTPSPTSTP